MSTLFGGLGRQIHDCVNAKATGVDAAVRRLSTEYNVRGLASRKSSFDNATVSDSKHRAWSYLPIQESARLGPQAGEVSDDVMQLARPFGADFRYSSAELPVLSQASLCGRSILGTGSFVRETATIVRISACNVRATGSGRCGSLLKEKKAEDHAGF
jgi:hypothetical protein